LKVPTGSYGAILRLVATAIAFGLGVVGFATVYHKPGFVALVGYGYRAAQLIVGQFPAELTDRQLPWTLEVARWALPLLTVWTTASLAWATLKNPVRLRVIRMRGDHLVVAGGHGVASQVVAGERHAGHPVIVWTENLHEDWVKAAGDQGAPSSPATGPGRGAAKLGLDRARSLLVAGDNDGANVALAGAAMDEALAHRPPGEPLLIIARVDNPDLRAPLERQFDWTGERTVARVRFASLPDIVARQLFKALLLDRFYAGENSARRAFLVGFSPISERYALKLLAGAHFRDGGKAELVVLDPEAASRQEVFFARRPGAASLATVAFETARTDEPALIAKILEQAIAAYGAPSVILVDPVDEAKALALAIAIDDFYRRSGAIPPPIHVNLPGGGPDDNLGCAITPYGELSKLADPELLLQEGLDSLARSSHEFYFENSLEEGDKVGSRASMYEWDMLPEAVRDDNRLAADCYELKLRDIGARLLPLEDGGAESLHFRPEELEALSRAEHDRWMAAKLIDGWRFGDTRDDAVKLHPDIVPYDALSEARKDLDRDQVGVITRLVGSAGLKAVRDLVVHVEGDSATPLELDPVIEALRTHYPDRALVLLGDFSDATVRAGFAKAQADAVRLMVSADPEAALSQAGRDQRPAGRRLYREADRLYALPGADPGAKRAFAQEKADLQVVPGRSVMSPTTIVIGPGGRVESAPWTR
jgi:hypothetical protein